MKILLAEDDTKIAETIKKHLLHTGFSVDVVSDGESVISQVQQFEYDVILLDWRMPKKNGFEVCTELRNNGVHTSIILLTALHELDNKVAALKAGADDYITKPFVMEEVIARIEAVHRRVNQPVPYIKCGKLILNPTLHTIEFEGSSVKLTEKEFELFNFFVANRGEVISRDTLYQKVWGITYNPSTNFLEVTIKNIRKKLEAFSKSDCIKSVYGEGYVFLGS